MAQQSDSQIPVGWVIPAGYPIVVKTASGGYVAPAVELGDPCRKRRKKEKRR